MTTEIRAYWEGWNDAMLGRWRPGSWPPEFRADYRAGHLEYRRANDELFPFFRN